VLEHLLRRRRRVGELRLGQPDADVVLALHLGRAQAVDRDARRDGDEPGLGVVDAAAVGLVPAQPGVLHDLLGLGRGAEHPVGDALQSRAQAVEGAGGIVHAGSAGPKAMA
jgi:hypothetical protein